MIDDVDFETLHREFLLSHFLPEIDISGWSFLQMIDCPTTRQLIRNQYNVDNYVKRIFFKTNTDLAYSVIIKKKSFEVWKSKGVIGYFFYSIET